MLGGVRRRCYIYIYINVYIYQEEGTRMQGGVRRRCYINMCLYMEEGTRIARAECEDGATIYICNFTND